MSMDKASLNAMISFAETAIRWSKAAGPTWIDNEQVRAAVTMYVGQVGEIISREFDADEIAAHPEAFGELAGFPNKIYHHYYRNFRVDVLRQTVDDALVAKIELWQEMETAPDCPRMGRVVPPARRSRRLRYRGVRTVSRWRYESSRPDERWISADDDDCVRVRMWCHHVSPGHRVARRC